MTLTKIEIAQLKDLLVSIENSRREFEELITVAEIQAMQSRIMRLINEGVFPEPSEDWPAVPWPPF